MEIPASEGNTSDVPILIPVVDLQRCPRNAEEQKVQGQQRENLSMQLEVEQKDLSNQGSPTLRNPSHPQYIDSEVSNPQGTSGSGTKRSITELNTGGGSSQRSDEAGMGEDSLKLKRIRTDSEFFTDRQNNTTTSGTFDMDKEKETTGSDISLPSTGFTSSSPRTSVACNPNPPAPKVPPIKIVLQSSHSGESDSQTLHAISQPHVTTTNNNSTGFPYIVSCKPIEPSVAEGISKDKIPDEHDTKSEVEIIANEKSYNSSESVVTTQLPPPQSETQTQKSEAISGSGTSFVQLTTSTTSMSLSKEDKNLKETVSTANLIIAASQLGSSIIDGSPNASGTVTGGKEKEKPTRVTRSSQRIATTAHSSPAASPKNSACVSPNHLESEPPIVSVQEKEPATETPKEGSELHPRKRKLKGKDKEKEKEQSSAVSNVSSSSSSTSGEAGEGGSGVNQAPGSAEIPLHPVLNCYEMYLNIRKQISRRRQNLFPVQPKPPQGFKDYLMNRGTYVLSTTPNVHLAVPSNSVPPGLPPQLKDLFLEQEKERHRLRLQQVVEKEKLVLSVEQEILRVHGRAARALSNQALPYSVCTFLKDEEVYNLLTPEQEEKDRNVRSRYNGRLFLSWLQDVDDKWEKIKESMVLRHHNEAESLFAVQKMDWEWKMKELGLCEPKATPVVDEISVPMVFVSDDFDLLPA